jgi:hypothetical protein
MPHSLHDDSPELARVAAAQQLLFPATPRAVSEEMGLNWWTVLKLHQDGWLSFAPEETPALDEAQEAELRFVGSLVTAGCDGNMLEVLLQGLERPYAYDVRRLFYDWSARCWRLLPAFHSDAEAAFADWVEALVQKGDIGSLSGIAELAQDALLRVRTSAQPADAPLKHWSVTSDGEAVQG